jgi:transposase
MARPASGKNVLEKAKEALLNARSVEELRQAQAVIMPLEYGFSMDQVAATLGISKGWACQLRMRFIRSGGLPAETKPKRGGRRRENMSKEEEAAFLAPFFDKAARGGILIVSEIKRALDERMGRETALASTYNLLHRNNWRKLAPDKRHPKIDVEAQLEWKKNSRTSSPGSTQSGLAPNHFV